MFSNHSWMKLSFVLNFFCLLLQLGVYKLRKPARRRMVTLSVQLSDCMEAFDY